jgi:hypothetical protein
MYVRKIGILVFALTAFVLGNGCKKADSGEPQSVPGASAAKESAPAGPAAIVYWAGAKHISTDANAAGFLKIWGLPETERLKAQTLDKLALAPWRLSGTNHLGAITNYAALVRADPSAALLRPLLDDLVDAEWYLEIRDAAQQPGQLALAVHLSPERAGLWETNLAAVSESISGGHRTPGQLGGAAGGWQVQVQATNAPSSLWPLAHHIEMARAGEWTIVGLAPDQNATFADLLSRVQHDPSSFANYSSNDWFKTTFNLSRLCAALGSAWKPAEDCPAVSLAVNGDGKNVLTRSEVHFSKPLPFEIEPWNIPTNLIHEPLHGFTAVQGLKSWLTSIPAWVDLQAGAAPNQLFSWDQGGTPFLMYAAAPLSSAPEVMTKLGPRIMDSFNPFMATNRMGKWERSTNSDAVVWTRVPVINPFVQSINLSGGSFLFTGMTPLAITNTPPPAGTLSDLFGRTNLVYFDRELTGPRVGAWMFVGQLLRIIFRRDQLPSESDSVAWLKVLGPLLGESKTVAIKTGPTDLSITRKSTFGFTAPELHALGDWFESSEFPLRPYSVVAKLPPLPARRRGASKPLPGQR